MSISALETLAAVREYLEAEILPHVPKAQRGEFRAALKLLDELGSEFNLAHLVLKAETQAMHALCCKARDLKGDESHAAAVDDRLERLGNDLQDHALALDRAQILHDEASACISAALAGLRELCRDAEHADAASAILGECYVELGHQAARRANWQSVFEP